MFVKSTQSLQTTSTKQHKQKSNHDNLTPTLDKPPKRSSIYHHFNIEKWESCAMSAKAKAYLAPPSYWSPVSAPGTTYAPVYSAPGIGAPGVPGVPGVPVPKGIPLPRPVVTLQVPPPKAAPQRTEAAILDLKDQSPG